MNVNKDDNNEPYEEERIKKEDYVEYSIEKSQDEEEQDSSKTKDNNKNLYTDIDDGRPKFVLIGLGIFVLLVIILILLVSCNKLSKKDSNNRLSSINVTNGDLLPNFDPNVIEYNVIATEDIVTLTCATSSKKAVVSGCNKRISLKNGCVDNEIKVIAQNGNKKTYTLRICQQEKDAPLIKNIVLEPASYTTSSVKVKVEVENTSDLHQSAYSFDGGKTWQSSNFYVVSENKKLQIQVRSKQNVKSAIIEKEIKTIDKTTPNVSITGTVGSGVETSSSVKLTANVTPATTISGYKYQWYNGNSAISGATSYTYTASSSGTYKVKVTTGAGVSKESGTYIVKIKVQQQPKPQDPKPDTITINSVSGNPTSWTNQNVTLTVNAYASTGLNSSAYSFDGGKTWQKDKTKAFSSNQTVSIVVRDTKGNKSTVKTVSITKIDKTTPTVAISGSKYVNEKLTATVTPSSTSSGYKYQWTNNSVAISGATSSTYTPTKAGTYTVIVTTGAGNSKTASVTVSNKVTAKAELQPYSGFQSGKWSNKDIGLKIVVTNGKLKEARWYKNGTLTNSTTSSNDVTIKVSGKWYAIVTTTDGQQVKTNEFDAKIDKTPPYTPRMTTSFGGNYSHITGAICYSINPSTNSGKTVVSHDIKTTNHLVCIVSINGNSMSIPTVDEDSGGSGIDYCEIVWAPQYGTSLGNVNGAYYDTGSGKLYNYSSIKWVRDTDKSGSGKGKYLRRCVDKAGNVGSARYVDYW